MRQEQCYFHFPFFILNSSFTIPHMNRTVIAVLLLVSICFAQSAPSPKAVLDADRAFNKATQEQRVEGWMSFMADNVVLFNLEAPVVGKDAVRKVL